MLPEYIWDARMAPFRVLGNLYFVGTKPASSHLIDTGEGLILLDSGFPETLYLTLQSIYELGFDPKNIRYILHSHGHIDHIGGTRALVELFGCKTILGRQDADYVTGARDLTFAKELGLQFSCPFTPDILLEDGDVFSLGNTAIRCVHTPGHTEGTFSFFWDIQDRGQTFRAGTHGGTGRNSMTREFLQAHGLPLSLREDFRNGLARLRREPVDVFIPNHQNQRNTSVLAEKLRQGQWDAFVDPDAWGAYLDLCERRLDQMLRQEETPAPDFSNTP